MEKKNIKFNQIPFLILLAVQFCLVCVFNLRDLRGSLDADLASTFFHFEEVLERGTLILPDWNHTTSLELDGAFLFALPLFFLTGDLFTAVGLSNILLTLLYLVVIYLLLKNEGVDKAYIYMTMALVISPHSFGMLDYFNMMFFGGSCYSVKVLVPLLLLLLLSMTLRGGSYTCRDRMLTAFVGGIYLLLLFATVFSTGTYAVLCGIFPVFFCLLLRAFVTGEWKHTYDRELIVIAAGTAAVTAVGMLLHGYVYPGAGRVMSVTRLGNHAANLDACVGGLFQIFGAVPGEELQVLSVSGIIYCIKYVFVLALLWIFILTVKNRLLSHRGISQYDGFLPSALSMLFAWNFFILFLADARYPGNAHTEYRYLLMGAFPCLLLIGPFLTEENKKWSRFQTRIASAVLMICGLILVYGNNMRVHESWDRSAYAVEFCEYARTLEVDSVIFLDDKESFQFCRAIDRNKRYGVYLSDVQSFHVSICDYFSAANWEHYGENHALAVISGRTLSEHVPEDMAARYEYMDSVLWFDIYLRKY
ncbi:MAG: hypothetical protein IJC59_01150 [Lachnospiraceae bacterium]|nr:hypothetical protein [Lachnospiraceae bacterium]